MDTDLPFLQWWSGARALAWAEETLSKPTVQSPTQVVIQRLRQVPGRGSSEWSREDYRFLAETIITAWRSLEPPTIRHAIRQARCAPQAWRTEWLAHALSQALASRHSMRVASGVSYVAVLRVTARIQGQKPIPKRTYADHAGVDRTSVYSKPWKPAIEDAESTFLEWIRRGEDAMRNVLADLDCVEISAPPSGVAETAGA